MVKIDLSLKQDERKSYLNSPIVNSISKYMRNSFHSLEIQQVLKEKKVCPLSFVEVPFIGWL